MEWERYNLLSKEEKEEYNYKFNKGNTVIVFWQITKVLFSLSMFFILVMIMILHDTTINYKAVAYLGDFITYLLVGVMYGLLFSLIEIAIGLGLWDYKRDKWMKTKFEVVKITKVKELKKKK